MPYEESFRKYQVQFQLIFKYPQGMKWTNDEYYIWTKEVASGLGYDSYSGRGCFAFTMIASDAAFGKIPVHEYKDRNKIKVGDILRINKDTHSVIVLKKLSKTKFKITEGNYNASINWGRIIDINETGFDYGLIKYKI